MKVKVKMQYCIRHTKVSYSEYTLVPEYVLAAESLKLFLLMS